MECVDSIGLLSEYHAGSLDETMTLEIHVHLGKCPPCMGLMSDLEIIIGTARLLRDENFGIDFPNENVLWRRIVISRTVVN